MRSYFRGNVLELFIFSITLTLLSMLLVKITRKPIPSVIVIVSLLIITLSGILRVVSPTLENLLPLIGAKSFAFGRVENNNTRKYMVCCIIVSSINSNYYDVY